MFQMGTPEALIKAKVQNKTNKQRNNSQTPTPKTYKLS